MSDGAERARASGPRSVRALVRRAWGALLLARTFESLWIGVAGACLTLAAAGERISSDPELLTVASCAGALAALAWFLEHASSADELALRLDRRLDQGGALALAHELEGRPGGLTPMGMLVQERVLARLRPLEAVRSSVPSFLPPLGFAAFAAGALALSLERTPSSGASEPELGRWIEGARAALARGELEARERPAPESARELLTSAERRLEALERTDEHALDARAAAAELGSLEDELARAASALERSSPLRPRIEEARAWLDAARARLEARGAGPAAALGGNPGQATGPDGSGTMEGSLMDTGRENAGPERAGRTAASRSVPGGETASGGFTLAESWWEPTYEDVVRRWIELSRAERRR